MQTLSTANAFQISEAEIIQQLKLSQKYSDILEALLARKIVNQTAQEMGIKAERIELQTAANEFRRQYGLLSAQETWTWLQKQGLSLEDLLMRAVNS